jgi:hypothetical protein
VHTLCSIALYNNTVSWELSPPFTWENSRFSSIICPRLHRSREAESKVESSPALTLRTVFLTLMECAKCRGWPFSLCLSLSFSLCLSLSLSLPLKIIYLIIFLCPCYDELFFMSSLSMTFLRTGWVQSWLLFLLPEWVCIQVHWSSLSPLGPVATWWVVDKGVWAVMVPACPLQAWATWAPKCIPSCSFLCSEWIKTLRTWRKQRWEQEGALVPQ